MKVWRPGRADLWPILLILLLPIAMMSRQLLGGVHADPLLYTGAIAKELIPGFLPGVPYVDPNNGFQTQALGARAAMDWLQGNVPWWNPYSGVGLPLAAEYQPGAFFPLVFLLLLPKGTVWMQVALEVLSGLGTYGLLRQMGLGRLAAATGGILYAFNGTLAWFAHGPATAVPFLPWLLWGIERAYAKADQRLAGGWRLIAFALALGLLAGFPETAYIGGLLALAWAIVRLCETPRGERLAFARRVALGGVVGVALAAPQVYAFFDYLPLSDTQGHDGQLAAATYSLQAFIFTLIAPFAYGPIFSRGADQAWIGGMWGGVGGYATLALVAVAAAGFWTRRCALAGLLLAWCVLTVSRSFVAGPLATLWNLIPGIALTGFARYVHPSWQLALVILAAWGIDALAKREARRRTALFALGVGGAIALAGAWLYAQHVWPHVHGDLHLRNWGLGSWAWALLTAGACVALMSWRKPLAAGAVALVLFVDAALLFTLPSLSTPRAGAVNVAAIDFLRANLGLQRFYSLGPIQPNYAAMFGIASINHNYLPVSRRWVEFVRANLDRGADSVVFNGARDNGDPTSAQELSRNVSAYEWVGVKLVVSYSGRAVLDGVPGAKKVYDDGTLEIHELPGTKPYFETLEGACTTREMERTRVVVRCEAPATLVRRELFFPGWSATVNGEAAAIGEHGALFQTVDLRAGRNEVRFRYAPPHVEWAWLASFAALGALAVSTARAALRARRARRTG